MTIDTHCGQDDGMPSSPGSQAEAHSQLALEQSALYAAKLAIARWIRTSSEAAAPVAPAADLARAAWYAEAQRNFQEWLGRGGFAQYEMAADELPGTSLCSVSASAATPAPSTSLVFSPTCIS
ncbi:MAG TPA: hypothetical protein VFS02_04175 [Telluria sp.]|nr:hypothetical protein [Telluria sp.]